MNQRHAGSLVRDFVEMRGVLVQQIDAFDPQDHHAARVCRRSVQAVSTCTDACRRTKEPMG